MKVPLLDFGIVGGNTENKGEAIWKLAHRNNMNPKEVRVRQPKKPYRRLPLT
jgi:hypothetical protein